MVNVCLIYAFLCCKRCISSVVQNKTVIVLNLVQTCIGVSHMVCILGKGENLLRSQRKGSLVHLAVLV